MSDRFDDVYLLESEMQTKEELPLYIVINPDMSNLKKFHFFNGCIITIYSYIFIIICNGWTKQCLNQHNITFSKLSKKLQKQMDRVIFLQVRIYM